MIAAIGGRGVIGEAIVKALRAHGDDVVVVTHDPKQARMEGYRYGDMLEPQSLHCAIEGAEVVVQSGMFPTYPIEKPKLRHTFMQFDGLGTEYLVAAARKAGVRRYVYISGAGITASPRVYYQAILRGESAVQNSGMQAVCIRPTLVYGPKDRGLNRILSVARKLPVLPLVGPGSQLEQPVYVNDVGDVVRQAVAVDAPQGVFEIGGPERFTIDEMLRRFFKHVGLMRVLVHIPYRCARFGAFLLERLPGPPLTTNAIDFLMEDFIADTKPLLSSFNLRLTPFEEGLSKYIGPAHAP